MSESPLVVVVAGPKGAGKSTTAPRLLRGVLSVSEFVNADPIAQGLSLFRPESVAIEAGRVMLARLRALARAREDFAYETTLASRSFARWLRDLRDSGYRAHLVFLSLPSADLAVARVAQPPRAAAMTSAEDRRPPAERVEDVASILRALRQAVREALLDHKRAGNPVAVWRDGRVVWIQPQDIPTDRPAGDGESSDV